MLPLNKEHQHTDYLTFDKECENKINQKCFHRSQTISGY